MGMLAKQRSLNKIKFPSLDCIEGDCRLIGRKKGNLNKKIHACFP